jgi:hypothetical protein
MTMAYAIQDANGGEQFLTYDVLNFTSPVPLEPKQSKSSDQLQYFHKVHNGNMQRLPQSSIRPNYSHS